MNKSEHLQFATLALQKLYPKYSGFIESLIEKIKPFWDSRHQQEKTHFIHLISYQPKEKLKKILMDLLSLLGLQSETVLLWDNPDINGSNIKSQFQSLQENYPVLPKVLVTDFFHDHFSEFSIWETSREARVINGFLKGREKLDFPQLDLAASDARQTLVLSVLDSFGDCNYLKTSLIFRFLWGKKLKSIAALKAVYVPEELHRFMDSDLIRRDELLFFSKDKPYFLKLAFNLIKLHQYLEDHFSQKSGFPISISCMAMDYFSQYVFYRKLNYAKLKQEAFIFFLPVFHQIPRIVSKFNEEVETLEIDFKAGWKFNVNHSNS